jgi:hypothetical protein
MEPDITPQRLTVIDIVTLTDRETRGALVLLAGSPDPVVTGALVDAVRRIVERTRVYGGPASPLPGPVPVPDPPPASPFPGGRLPPL